MKYIKFCLALNMDCLALNSDCFGIHVVPGGKIKLIYLDSRPVAFDS